MRRVHVLRVALLAAAGVASLGLGGCKSVSKSDYNQAIQEANDLRAQNEALQGQLEDCEARYAALADQGSGDVGDEGLSGLGSGVRVRRGASGETIVEVAGDVLFDSGSVVLKNQAKSTLDRLAAAIKSNYSTNTIRVEGYTDTDPIVKSGWKTNERLSAERALAVEQHLVSRGVDNNRIYSAAFGPARQRGTKAESRRVEVVILP